MTPFFTIVAFIGCIPLCRAVTISRRNGFRGFSGFCVWALETGAREMYAFAGGIRKFVEGREVARRHWIEEVER